MIENGRYYDLSNCRNYQDSNRENCSRNLTILAMNSEFRVPLLHRQRNKSVPYPALVPVHLPEEGRVIICPRSGIRSELHGANRQLLFFLDIR